jgi:hypothetical protein
VLNSQALERNQRAVTNRESKATAIMNPIVRDRVAKSNGFFPWVTLAVQSILQGLQNGDSLTCLRTRLQDLPSNLRVMYDHVMNKIPEVYQVGASRIYQIVLAVRMIQNGLPHDGDEAEPLTLIDPALSDGDL